MSAICLAMACLHSAGLATEFMSKAEVKKYYSKKGPSGYNDIVPDFHRSRYATCCYGNHTIHVVMVTMVSY